MQGEVKYMRASEVKPGSFIIIDGFPCKVTKVDKSKPGKHGATKARIEAVGIFDGQKRNDLVPTSADLASPIMEKETAQVIADLGHAFQLMSLNTYETFELPKDAAKDADGTVEPGKEVEIISFENNRKITRVKG